MNKRIKGVGMTRLSSKGQVVLPAKVRKEFKIRDGTTFSVFGMDDKETIIIKKFPSHKEIENLKDIDKNRKRIKNKEMEILC